MAMSGSRRVRSHVMLKVTLSHLLVLRPSPRFSRIKVTAGSLEKELMFGLHVRDLHFSQVS